jgi:PASTA domain/Glucodextranase, domain B
LSRRLSAFALLALALAGCGTQEKPAAPPVRLSVDSPSDMAVLHEDSVEVHGVVSPGTARVSVEGKYVGVSGGRFSARVGLQPGTNLIDVVAGADGGARPAMVAVRVRRQVTVKVPDLTGYTPSDAKDALAGLGLEPDVQETGGLFDFLLPEDARVCDTDPPPGTDVDPGSTVHVFAAKRC